MSKKIALTIAIIAVLTFLFVIGVSAENIGGIEYTLNPSNKTATFAASNRTDCTLTRVVIPETVVGADGETYTVTTIADRSIGKYRLVFLRHVVTSLFLLRLVIFKILKRKLS